MIFMWPDFEITATRRLTRREYVKKFPHIPLMAALLALALSAIMHSPAVFADDAATA